jgi:hypothetical protein
MKITIIPGVGFHTDIMPPNLLIKTLKKTFPEAELTWFNWKHNLSIPDVDLNHKASRKFISEIILDFQAVVRDTYTFDVPKADYYIGHSGGSIFALLQEENSIIFGSPAIMVESLNNNFSIAKLFTKARKVLNIINTNDIIAYPIPLPNIENWIMSSWWANPLMAHCNYWDNKKVVSKIISQLKVWQSENPK